MRKAEFEKQLFLVCQGFFANDGWTDKHGRNFERVMDELALNTSDEQWLIVDETINLLRDPDYITGEVACDTPVSPNEWELKYV